MNILLAEDSRLDSFLLETIFREAGWNCCWTILRDGQEALAYVDQNSASPQSRPDLLILDGYLPKVNGLEILRKVKSNPHWSSIPVLMLTGSCSPVEQSAAWTLGALLCLAKPSDLDGWYELPETLQKALSRSSAAHEELQAA
jgi:DNA-binding response OmpR family regulator